AQIDDEPVPVLAPHLRVPSGDVGVVQSDVALARAAEDDHVAGELVRLAVDIEASPGLVRETELLRLLGGYGCGRGGRRREDLRPAHDGLWRSLELRLPLLLRGLDETGGDPELAHLQVV